MADFDIEPPSFSLGLDLDLDSEPQATVRPEPPLRPSRFSSTIVDEEDDDFESPTEVPRPRLSDPPRALKRLRRGPTVEARKERSQEAWFDVDDDIEEFSPEEDFPRGKLPHSVCSSSKPSLHGRRILTSQCISQGNSKKREKMSSAEASVNGETSSRNVLFPKLTVSPLRRFQLIESDSDDPSVIEDMAEEAIHVQLPLKDKPSNISTQKSLNCLQTGNASIGKSQTDDLWKDFFSEKSFSVPTPAFDEVCEEYFTSMKKKSNAEISCSEPINQAEWDANSLPPAHCYFFHKDARIRNLVSERLPHFFPLGAGNNQGYKQQGTSVIDYMGQFNHENNTRLVDRSSNVKKSSARAKKNVKSQVDSENWVNTKNHAGLPKDAGKRRVQAVSKSAGGHWYTGSDGRRVYVTKNGQELTGQIAYRHYRKESGVGFKNSKKKTTAGKKTAGKKNVASKKK